MAVNSRREMNLKSDADVGLWDVENILDSARGVSGCRIENRRDLKAGAP